jgi:hypothetical protein
MFLVRQTPPKGRGTYIEHQKRPCGRSALSVIAAQTVRACVESVRVPDLLQDLLAKPTKLTRELTCNGSRPPLYIDEGLTADSTLIIDSIKSTYQFLPYLRGSFVSQE